VSQAITVVASAASLLTPDPAQSIVIHDQVLDANPGRPGAPISIPGLPIETASGGIKAPQYFAPGVAGDHGEPIAQYFQIRDFLYPNNLPANAHGNGYADPNFLIPPTIEAVTIDGGAFNVRGGNNSVDLAASYVPRERFNSFVQAAHGLVIARRASTSSKIRFSSVLRVWAFEGGQLIPEITLKENQTLTERTDSLGIRGGATDSRNHSQENQTLTRTKIAHRARLSSLVAVRGYFQILSPRPIF
jgi:hypothetical protein